MSQIIVILPAYNEETTIEKVIQDISDMATQTSHRIDIVVINDGSTDNTLNVVKKLNCEYIHLEKNKGKNIAISHGLKYALLKGYQYVIQMDADGQHPPSHIPYLLKYLSFHNIDVLIASRFMKNDTYRSTLLRKMGNYYLNRLLTTLFSQSVTDCTSGYRLLSHKAAILSERYYRDNHNEVTILCKYWKHRLRIKEVPISMQSRQGGKSSFNLFLLTRYGITCSIALIISAIVYHSLKKETYEKS
ncbi:glycosyltransferase family 2 protein [Candidatus Woesebacteria bacterium]|nr:glycosyltransferase family 2 protein [Candidatus Woesebacteria bacterium]